MKRPVFTGAATAIVSPFRDGRIDLAAYDRLIEYQYEGGISAIVVCGTTGENPTLSPKEHEILYRRTVELCAGRMKVIAGIGSNDTEKALSLAKLAAAAGADATLMVTPYYNKTTQKGLISHFTYVADRSPLPVILYNVPTRTGVGIQPETYAALSAHPNINGVKEAGGDIAAFTRAKALCGSELVFWSGNDMDTVPMMALGAQGVISVASNLLPETVTLLCRLCELGDFPSASALGELYADLFDVLFAEVNPIPIKTALGKLGLCSPEMRLPLVPMSPQNEKKLDEVMRRHRLL